MIPKIIHYCWLSNDEYPEKIQYCINSWKKVLPDYEIMLWDLKRFDIESSEWCKQAFEVKKYAFAADYIRCFALYNYGGIYLDSDVEVLKSFDNLLSLPYFIGFDHSNQFEPAIMGYEPYNQVLKEMLVYYKDKSFINKDGTYNVRPLPYVMEEVVKNHHKIISIENISDFIKDSKVFCIFPYEYFSPKRQDNLKIEKNKKTYSIHHFNASWYSPKQRLFKSVSKILGFRLASAISRLIKI